MSKFIFLASLVLLIGCNTMSTFKNFSYIDVKQVYSWGLFKARLLGTDKKVDNNLSIRGEKYELITSFSSTYVQDNIVIDSLELYDSNILKFKIKNKLSKFIKHSEGDRYIAINLFKPIKLDYHQITLSLKWHFENDIDKTIYAIEKDFITDYKEEEITFWDVLMGI